MLLECFKRKRDSKTHPRRFEELLFDSQFEKQYPYFRIESEIHKDYLIFRVPHLRFIMSSKNNKRKTPNYRNLEAGTEAAKILRNVRDEEAFYFYEAIGKPTGEIARSLPEFLDKIKSVKPESLLFHLQRRDFQNWIERTLVDPKLSQEIDEISRSNRSQARTRIYTTIENRIKELTEPSVAFLVDGKLEVAPRNPLS